MCSTLRARPDGIARSRVDVGPRGCDLNRSCSPRRPAAPTQCLREPFEQAARDRSRWGPSKLLMAQMPAEGVEPGDPDALAAWMADFNSAPLRGARAHSRDLGIGRRAEVRQPCPPQGDDGQALIASAVQAQSGEAGAEAPAALSRPPSSLRSTAADRRAGVLEGARHSRSRGDPAGWPSRLSR